MSRVLVCRVGVVAAVVSVLVSCGGGVVWFGGWCVGVGESCFFVAVFWVFVFLAEVGGAFGAAAVGDLYPGAARGGQYRDRVFPCLGWSAE